MYIEKLRACNLLPKKDNNDVLAGNLEEIANIFAALSRTEQFSFTGFS